MEAGDSSEDEEGWRVAERYWGKELGSPSLGLSYAVHDRLSHAIRISETWE